MFFLDVCIFFRINCFLFLKKTVNKKERYHMASGLCERHFVYENILWELFCNVWITFFAFVSKKESLVYISFSLSHCIKLQPQPQLLHFNSRGVPFQVNSTTDK